MGPKKGFLSGLNAYREVSLFLEVCDSFTEFSKMFREFYLTIYMVLSEIF